MLKIPIGLLVLLLIGTNNYGNSQDASRLGVKFAYSEGIYLSTQDLPKFNIITFGLIRQKRISKYVQLHLGLNYGILHLKDQPLKMKSAGILGLRLGFRKMIYKDFFFVNGGFDFDYDIKKLDHENYFTLNGLGAYIGLEIDFHHGEFYVLNISSDFKYGSIVDFKSNIKTSFWTKEKEQSYLSFITPQLLFAYKFF
jgi:hypothetical protein